MAEQPVDCPLPRRVQSSRTTSSCKPSSRRLLKVTADVSLPSQCSPANSNTSKSTTRNAIAQAVAVGLLEKTERRSYCAVSLPNILTYGEAITAPRLKATHEAFPLRLKPTHEAFPLPRRIVLDTDRLNREWGAEILRAERPWPRRRPS